MPVNPKQEPQVNVHSTPPEPSHPHPIPGMPSPDKSAAQIAQEMLQARNIPGGVDPTTLQVLMSMMLPMVTEAARTMAIELRKPTPDEEAKLLADKERQKQRSVQAAKAGQMEAAMIKQQQTQCQHVKPNGEHTFRGQVHSNGWAEIKCQRCLVKFIVRPLPEHIQNGLNLGEIRGLTIEHLRHWQKNSAEIDRRLRQSQAAMLGAMDGVSNMAPQSSASGL